MFTNAIVVAFALAASTLVSAAPAAGIDMRAKLAGCDLSKVRMSLPAGQTGLLPQAGAPEYVTVGYGVQNYTCQAGVWTSVGAVASLYDASCAVSTPYFKSLAELAFDVAPKAKQFEAPGGDIKLPFGGTVSPLIHHFFVNAPNGATGVVPRFNLDHTSTYSILSKAGSIPSPNGTDNVAWLQLNELQGPLASTVYRINTVKGQPPSSCTAPSTQVLSVQYSAMYWFFK